MNAPDPDTSLTELLQTSSPTRFDDGFADRVMARLDAQRETTLDDTIVQFGKRFVPWLAAAAVALAMIDWRASRAEVVEIASASIAGSESSVANWSSYQ